MLSKLKPHLITALIFFVLTLSQQYSFYFLKGFPIHWFSIPKYLGIYAFLFAGTFVKGRKTRFFFLSFVILLFSGQMAHLSYFGTQVLPSEFYAMIFQAHEIVGTLKEEFSHVLIPVIFTAVPMVMGWYVLKKWPSTYEWKAVSILFWGYLVYNPARTYVTGNTWGRQPSIRELGGMNNYLSMSYFVGKILPEKILGKSSGEIKNDSLLLVLEKKQAPEWDKIILVLGESLTPYHMELFGYTRPTTPFLKSLKDLTFTKGISSGVSTDISVAFFLNLGYGDAGSIKASKGKHCLFRLAKDQGYRTHFLSIQSQEQLRYIAPYLCSSSLDDSRFLEELAPEVADHQAAPDRKLLPHLKTLLEKNGKEFILLHQRGSHAPWNLRASTDAKKFSDPKVDPRINDYDNSVVDYDLFWKELDSIAARSKEKILVLYISDHGESLGEDGSWGHGTITPRSFEVPILVKSYNRAINLGDLPKPMTQYNFGLLIAEELGYHSSQSSRKLPADFMIYGNDIDGFAGKAEVRFENGSYTFKLVL